MKPWIIAAVALAATPALAQTLGGWVSDSKGCKVWQLVATPQDRIDWSGACRAGLVEGSGTLKIFRGSVLTAEYTGDTRNGKLHGRGQMKWPGGAQYEGEWRDGLQSGQGTLLNADGSRYEGQWQAGIYEGEGVSINARGARYEGHYHAGLLNGPGRTIKPESTVEATFSNGKIVGPMTWKTKAGTYTGETSGGCMNGQGTFIWSTGERYDGQWIKGHPNGNGTMNFGDGTRFEGEWKDGVPSGSGTYFDDRGGALKGTWVGGLLRRTDVRDTRPPLRIRATFGNGCAT